VTERRFPPPWSIEELNDACFIVKDSAGQKLAYVYFEEEPGRRSAAPNVKMDVSNRRTVPANVRSNQESIQLGPLTFYGVGRMSMA